MSEEKNTEYVDLFDCFNTPFEVGRYDAVCGLPDDDKLKDNQEYINGRKQGEKELEELYNSEMKSNIGTCSFCEKQQCRLVGRLQADSDQKVCGDCCADERIPTEDF